MVHGQIYKKERMRCVHEKSTEGMLCSSSSAPTSTCNAFDFTYMSAGIIANVRIKV